MNRPELLHALLQHLTRCLTVYVCHQIDCGAQASAPVPRVLTSPSRCWQFAGHNRFVPYPASGF